MKENGSKSQPHTNSKDEKGNHKLILIIMAKYRSRNRGKFFIQTQGKTKQDKSNRRSGCMEECTAMAGLQGRPLGLSPPVYCTLAWVISASQAHSPYPASLSITFLLTGTVSCPHVVTQVMMRLVSEKEIKREFWTSYKGFVFLRINRSYLAAENWSLLMAHSRKRNDGKGNEFIFFSLSPLLFLKKFQKIYHFYGFSFIKLLPRAIIYLTCLIFLYN